MKDLNLAKNNLLPKDYFYYWFNVSNKFTTGVSDGFFNQPQFILLQNLLNPLLKLFFGFDCPLIKVFSERKNINNHDIVFATTFKLGLATAFLKQHKLIKSRLVVSTCGLFDELIKVKKQNQINRLKKAFNSVDIFISGSSWYECRKISGFLKITLKKFRFGCYGIDTNFWKPQKVKPNNYILGIGIDPTRDWLLYKEIALNFPKEKFFLATYPHLVNAQMPDNVTIKYLDAIRLRRMINGCKIVLILSKPNHHFGGQSTAIRAMSCGKAVIISQTPGSNDFNFRNNIHCLYVKPNNRIEVINAINKLNLDLKFRKKQGFFSRQLTEKEYPLSKISHNYISIFKKLIGN